MEKRTQKEGGNQDELRFKFLERELIGGMTNLTSFILRTFSFGGDLGV